MKEKWCVSKVLVRHAVKFRLKDIAIISPMSRTEPVKITIS